MGIANFEDIVNFAETETRQEKAKVFASLLPHSLSFEVLLPFCVEVCRASCGLSLLSTLLPIISFIKQTMNQLSLTVSASASTPLKGIIFDMDGTLIQLNVVNELIQQIYQVADEDKYLVAGEHLLGNYLERDDLEVMIANLSPEGQRKAKNKIQEILQRHVDNMIIQEGGPALVAFLARNGVKRAVLTRNYERNAIVMQQMYSQVTNEATFDLIIGKDTPYDTSLPPAQEIFKADRIRQICYIWGCDTSEVIMLGDSITDDIVEGNRAGCGGTVLLQPRGYQLNHFYGTSIGDSRERTPTMCVESLIDYRQYLEAPLCQSISAFLRHSQHR